MHVYSGSANPKAAPLHGMELERNRQLLTEALTRFLISAEDSNILRSFNKR